VGLIAFALYFPSAALYQEPDFLPDPALDILVTSGFRAESQIAKVRQPQHLTTDTANSTTRVPQPFHRTASSLNVCFVPPNGKNPCKDEFSASMQS
jgi:hypothetical protein